MTTIESLYDIYKRCTVVTTDSRNCPQGSLFFALRGATFDGNRFAAQALEAGSAYAVVDDASVVKDDRYLLVDNVLRALQELARFHRRTLGLPVIAITGTNGKTTTKELTAACLATTYDILATEGNLNNAIGVPLTLLRLRASHRIAVVEMGASHPGDIRELVDIAEPDYGIITNVGKAHLQGFGSFEGVVATKCELYDFLRRRGGKVFLHGENAHLSARVQGLETITYGTTEGQFVSGQLTACSPYLSFAFTHDGHTSAVDTHLIGGYNLYNALAAATIALYFGVPQEKIAAAVAAYEPQNRRSQLMKTARNTLIVDAYNANPTSMAAALDNFFAMTLPHKVVILGDMGELGADSREEHRKIVARLRDVRDVRVLLAGKEFSAVGEAFTCFPDTDALVAYLQANPLSDSTVLIKGSRSMRLEKCLNCL